MSPFHRHMLAATTLWPSTCVTCSHSGADRHAENRSWHRHQCWDSCRNVQQLTCHFTFKYMNCNEMVAGTSHVWHNIPVSLWRDSCASCTSLTNNSPHYVSLQVWYKVHSSNVISPSDERPPLLHERFSVTLSALIWRGRVTAHGVCSVFTFLWWKVLPGSHPTGPRLSPVCQTSGQLLRRPY